MGFWESVLDRVHAPLSGEPEFRWLQSGLGTKYLLITCVDGQPDVQIYGTSDLSILLSELSALLNDQKECVLLGVENWEVTCKFFQLDPNEALERLGD